MGRDRDPFDRALTALRARLVRSGPLQGAPLLVTTLAGELGVSPTPVREALAWLAGEGVIARRSGGYAAQVHDRQSLMRLYGLAGLLADAVLADQVHTVSFELQYVKFIGPNFQRGPC